MKKYYRIMLGAQNKFGQKSLQDGYIGVGFLPNIDFSNQFAEHWRDFNKNYIPEFISQNPEKSKVAAGLACASIWVLGKDMNIGDLVLTPSGNREYHIGEITGPYEYVKDSNLPHQRKVKWLATLEARDAMSQELKNSAGSALTLINLTKYSSELENLIYGTTSEKILISQDSTIEDPSLFALEKHLEDFLIHNWSHTELGKNYCIYEEDGQIVGQQYPSDTGPIDILAISKDKKELLVVELKKGRASDVVVGQIQRYMGYVIEELAEENQTVRGVIIAFEDDLKIQRALSVAKNIEFYTYKIDFKLLKK